MSGGRQLGLQFITASKLLNRKLTLLQTCPSCRSLAFHERDKKSGYDTDLKRPKKKLIKEGIKMIGPELGKFKDECVTRWRSDTMIPLWHGDYEMQWKFDSEQTIKDWHVTTDKDHNEGKSTAEFVLGPNKTGLFRGHINTSVVKDGVVKNAGYCSLKGPRNMLSFKRERPYEWDDYTHLLMRVRGDGRTYQVVLGMNRYFDLQWNDSYQYALFTRGGPYWQIAKIPFSKFFLGAKGRIQDKQEGVQLDKVSYVAVTCGDDVDGPFHLEIDFIGVYYDSVHKEKFAYEMYQVSASMIG